MPYSIRENDSRCPAAKPWAVVNSDTGDLKGCHPTEGAARQQQKALYANVPDADRGASPSSEGRYLYPAPTTSQGPTVMYTTPSSKAW